MSERQTIFDNIPAKTDAAAYGIISYPSQIEQLRDAYPLSTATLEDNRRAHQRQADYGVFGVGEPIKITPEDYEIMTEQMDAYIRICQQLAVNYDSNLPLRRYIQKILLDHEPEAIQALINSLPYKSATGVTFGSDVIFEQLYTEGQKSSFKTLEVNLGATGGIPEVPIGQAFFPNLTFPMSSEAIMMHSIHSINQAYTEACEHLGLEQKPFAERKVVLVENNGWYPGSVGIVEAYRKFGMNIEIAPREALTYDPNTNKLYLGAADTRQDIDQIILDFALEEDISSENGIEKQGHIIQALTNKAVVADSSVFAPIVLSSKAISALIDHMCRNPQGALAQKLDMDPNDLEIIEGMFPVTDQWGKAFFDRLGVNGFMLRQFLKDGSRVAKVTSDGLYGGRGVYIFDEGETKAKVLQDFIRGVRDKTMGALLAYKDRAGNDRLRRYLKTALGGIKVESGKNGQPMSRYFELATFLGVAGTKNEARLNYILHTLTNTKNPDELQEKLIEYSSFSEDEISRIVQLYATMNHGEFHSGQVIESYLKELAYFIRRSVGDKKVNPDVVNDLQKRMVEKLSTGMYLPVILQEKVKTQLQEQGKSIELRVAGSIGTGGYDHTVFVSAFRAGVNHEPPKIMYPVITGIEQPPYQSTEEDPISAILEAEEEAPLESTSRDLSLLPEGHRFNFVLDPMAGNGRHGRVLSTRLNRYLGIDISPIRVEEAQILSQAYENLNFREGDTRTIFDTLEDKPDGIIIPGNSLSYFTHDEQIEILRKSFSALTPGGVLSFDITDPVAYDHLLKRFGSIIVDTVRTDRRTYNRIGHRALKEVAAGRYSIENLLVYLNGSRETTHETDAYHMFNDKILAKTLTKIGFRNVVIARLTDDYYSGDASMMWHRFLVRAEK